MTCPSCGHENPATNRFCGGCGTALARVCPSCAHANAPDHRFCGACGVSLVARPEEKAEVRKVVTIVFADLIGSTALHERLDPESVSRLMDRYHRAVRAPVEAHGGTVVQLLGDGVMCAFGVPHVAEDDAIRAVRAAVAVQDAFREFAREERDIAGNVGLRVAVNTGEVVVSDEYAAGIGDPLNVAARLQQEARDGDVLIGESTQRLVRELVTLEPRGVFALKGRAETVAAYRVVSLDRPAGVAATPFVGREAELRRVLAVCDAAVATRRARLAVILGSPGLGKSRLMAEVARRLGDGATVLTAHCEAAGGATFAPIARALRAHLRIEEGAGGDAVRAAVAAALPRDDATVLGNDAELQGNEAAAPRDAADRSRIADGIAALLAGTPASPEETFFVIRRLLAALAAAQPVVLAIDDLHWAEPLLLDLAEHLIQWSTEVPLLVLAAARPELRETRSSLATPGDLVADVVTLAGLDAGAATRLAANVIGAAELPAAVAGRVLATSEGNPLFVGELVRMLVADGALKREGDRWTTGVELTRLEMPPTIQALLAARIERLRPEERTVLERAAVVGRQFSRAAVTHLLPREITDLDARLEALRRSELIEPDTAWFLGEPALRFHHVLVRDAAYRRLLKNTRAELHARFADWLETRVGDAVEHDETIGWHLEQAHQHLRELGPVDEQGRALGERASRYLAAAGRRALARDDLPLAGSLLGRALDRLDPADAARADLALDWCEALLAAGDVGPAAAAVDELGRFVGESPRLRAWHTCFAGELAVLTDPQALRATADTVAAAAETLAAADDAAGEAKAHFVLAMALVRLGKIGDCEAALDRALAAARRGRGDRRRANAVLAGAPLAALWGPSPVTRASGRCLDVVRVLRITQGAPGVEAVALRCQAVLEALRGRGDAARRMIASSRRMVEELGITQGLLETEAFAGLIELIEGDTAAAERSLRTAYDGLRAHGLGIDAARAAALLGRTFLAQGRTGEAEALSRESEALAGDDLQAAITWRRVRAEALARRGEQAAAVELARAAVDIAAATDALLYHADARLALAAALRAAGRPDDAAAEEARAIELWEAKGAVVLAERAHRDVGRVSQRDRSPDDRREVVHRARRRVRPNAATANVARFEAGIVARDVDAIAAHIADSGAVVDHPIGATYDRQQSLEWWQRTLLRTQGLTYRCESLATFGDSLALFHQWMSASGAVSEKFDVGASEGERILLIEVDAQGRRRRTELFAADRLGDAIARLYESYADCLPDGPARARAAATARSVAVQCEAFDIERYGETLSPTIDFVDHRIMGVGTARGKERCLRFLRTLSELADDIAVRVDDVLDLRPEGLLVRLTNSGIDRATGGAFERNFILLWLPGPDGLVARVEYFDSDRDAEALVRFDEFLQSDAGLDARSATAGFTTPPPRAAAKPRRRVLANAATANAARMDAVIAGRDAEALSELLAADYESVEHPTGGVYGREGVLAGIRALLRARDPVYRHQPLATLGDTLALFRVSWSANGFAGGTFDVGPYEMQRLNVIEVDAQGRRRRDAIFDVDRLGDAVVRLYRRYAELLPAGPARVRAAATARAVAAMAGAPELDRLAAAFAPGIEGIDHRVLGTYSASGARAVLEGYRALFDLSAGIAWVDDAVLDLKSDALLVARTHSAIARDGGGAYERPFILLLAFGADGLITHIEWFDTGRDAQALTRFDEVTARKAAAPIAATAPSLAKTRARRVRPNAVTANAERLDAAMAARDGDALAGLVAEHSEVVEHTTGATYGSAGTLASQLALLRARDLHFRHEPLATLGDSLALLRLSISASGVAGAKFDVGAYENEVIDLDECDAYGRSRRTELFAPDRLGDAVARLYERYGELLSEGPDRDRAAATARTVAAMLGPVDDKLWALALAPDVEMVDHRILGTVSGQGKDVLLQHIRGWLDVGSGLAQTVDEVLDLTSDALLTRRRFVGTDRVGGGTFERPLAQLLVFDADGLVTKVELFDTDRAARALACFDEVTTEAPQTRLAAARSAATETAARRVRPNAATACSGRAEALIAARDADAFPALLADELEVVDHTTGVVFDRQGQLGTLRALLKAQNPAVASETLATLGDLLALKREATSASGFVGKTFDVGAYEKEEIVLLEVDAQGRYRRREVFALDRLGDAVVRLYARYAELLPDGPARTRAAATARSVAVYCSAPFDPDRLAAVNAPDIEAVDHRILGHWFAHGAEALLRHNRSWLDVADDFAARDDDILALEPNALLSRRTFSGIDRAGGGAFEKQFILLCTFGTDGLVTRTEYFDADRNAEALARFDELTTEPAAVASRAAESPARRVRANAATAHVARLDAAIAGRDADALPALLANEVEVINHTTGIDFDRQGALASWYLLLKAENPTSRSEPLATLGDSVALCRWSTSARGYVGRTFDVGAYEQVEIALIEVDAEERERRVERFAADRLGDAVVRLYERYAELLPDGPERARAVATARCVAACVGPEDIDRVAATLAPLVDHVDHRIIGVESSRGAEAVLRALRSLHEVADDVGNRVDDVLAVRSDAGLIRVTNFGTDRAGGGIYERPFLALALYGADGLLARLEQFDVGHEAEALARFDELVREQACPEPSRRVGGPRAAPAAERFANAAARAYRRLRGFIRERDWESLVAIASSTPVLDDRRRLVRLMVSGEGYFAQQRILCTTSWAQWDSELIATRGDHLALFRDRMAGTAASGVEFENEQLVLEEADPDGRLAAAVIFDPDDLDAAHTELESRYAAGEGAPYAALLTNLRTFGQSLVDREALARLLPEDFTLMIHRRFAGTGAPLSRDEFLDMMRINTDDLDVRSRIRADHVPRISPTACVTVSTLYGTAAGGAFEIPIVNVFRHDGSLLHASEAFDPDQFGVALARYEELVHGSGEGPPRALGQLDETRARLEALGTGDPTGSADDRPGGEALRLIQAESRPGSLRIPPNAATRALDRARQAFETRDWTAFEALCAPTLLFDDRRRGILLTGDRDMLIAGERLMARSETRSQSTVLATAGHRLALGHVRWTGPGDAVDFEVEALSLTEVDAEGRFVAILTFDADDRRAAALEMLERGGRAFGPVYLEVLRAVNAHDVERLRAVLSDDFVLRDHRRTGLGKLGAEEYLASVAALFAESSDLTVETLCVIASEPHGRLLVARNFGTLREGGAFESVYVGMGLIRGERITAAEMFEPEDLGIARARFEALGAGATA